MASVDQLKQIFQLSLTNPQQAEAQLAQAKTSPNYALTVLQVVAQTAAPQEATIRLSAATQFKNAVNYAWNPSTDDEGHDLTGGIRFTAEERVTIKENLVQLMCTTPPQIQAQLSESIALIARTDYHQQWQSLMPSLVRQFESADLNTVIGVLKTANAIFKMFCHVGRSDELYDKIAYSLAQVASPLLVLMKKFGQAVGEPQVQQDKNTLTAYLEGLRLICRIVYSLNYQDLPEFFEDHMGEWMEEYAKYFQPGIFPQFANYDEPSPLDKLQSAIVEILRLYADKDEEVYVENYMKQFTELIWNRLMSLSKESKHDVLATRSIRYLASLVMKPMHTPFFAAAGVLPHMISKIVIPNLIFSEEDEERFEDDPDEFMRTEIEGSDSESRRTAVQQLLNGMCRNMEQATTEVCKGHIQSLLQESATNPAQNWRQKDIAIHLMMSIAARRESMTGVSEVNPHINLMEFFTGQILPELQNSNHDDRPIVKAAAIKFVTTFRKQFSRDHCVQLLPLFIAHLHSPHVVVHTFAAHAIERMLVTKDAATNQVLLGRDQLRPFLDNLFAGLFPISCGSEWGENEYAMKCVMRSLATIGPDVVRAVESILTQLVAALGKIMKNQNKPDYNHCVFESIAILIRSVCSVHPDQVDTFVAFLRQAFEFILQNEVSDFTPYVFQILAQLLELRPPVEAGATGLGEFFDNLYPMVLHPNNWEQKGNIPALCRFVCAYIEKMPMPSQPEEFNSCLRGRLGIFQKLLALKATDVMGIQILNAIIMNVDMNQMINYIPEIFRIMLFRLKQGGSKRFSAAFFSFVGLYSAKNGGEALSTGLDGVQANLSLIIGGDYWARSLRDEPPTQRVAAKIQVLGVIRFLTEGAGSTLITAHPQDFTTMVLAVVNILSSPSFVSQSRTDGLDMTDVVDVSYDSQFSELKFSRSIPKDPFPDHPSVDGEFVAALAHISQQHAGRVGALLQNSDPKMQENLQGLLTKHGARLA